MVIALAAIRRAAKKLREKQQPVSKTTLARALDVPASKVDAYLKGVNDLRYELGVVSKRGDGPDSEKYRTAIRRLCAARMIITPSRIARLAKSSSRATSNWCRRHKKELQGVSLVSERVFTHHRLMQRIRWYVRLKGSDSKKIRVKALALAVGMDRTALQRLFKDDPSFRQELGV